MPNRPRSADIDALDDLIAGRRRSDRAASDPDLRSRAAAALVLDRFSESGPQVDEDAVWRRIEAGLERTPQRRPLARWLRLRPQPPRVLRGLPAVVAALVLMVAVAAGALLLSTESTSAHFLEDVEELSAITADALSDGELDADEVASLDQLSTKLLEAVQSNPAALAKLDLDQLSAVIATLNTVRELLASHGEPVLQQTATVSGAGDEEPESDRGPAVVGSSPDDGGSALGNEEPASDGGSALDGDEPGATGDEQPAAASAILAGRDGDDGSPDGDDQKPGSLTRSLASLGTVSDSVQDTLASQLIARARDVCGGVGDEAGLNACEDAVDAAEDACKAYAKAARKACKDDVKSLEKAAESDLRALKAECDALSDKDAGQACKETLGGDDERGKHDKHGKKDREKGGKKHDEDDHDVDNEDDD